MTLSLNLMLAALVALAGLAVITFVLSLLYKRRPRKLDQTRFKSRWKSLQTHCANRTTWPLAVIDADKLLDEALKRLGYRGKTMGERMVAAQRDITDNDSVWYGHKLRNKIVHEDIKLNKRDVQQALKGFLSALRDLGAL